ncbi:MAG: IS1380 family transposase [Acidobacteriota bacterium]
MGELRVEYTGRPVSGWGGLVGVIRFLDRLGIRRFLRSALPDGRRSPNQVPVEDIALSLFATVLTGGSRFSHVERIRQDEVIRGGVGVKRLASAMTLTRYFGGFVQSQVEHLSDVLNPLFMSTLKELPEGEVIDLDSTVFERYGRQEGSVKGHNPRQHGRPSHHPRLAIAAGAKTIIHGWLRSGNTSSSRGVRQFVAEVLARAGMRVRAVRADSGFFETALLDELEARSLDYAIAVRMNPLVKRTVLRVPEWRPFGPGLEAGEVAYQSYQWPRPRRLILVREEIRRRPEARGRRLFDDPDSTYHAVITSLGGPPEEVWRFYNGRADSEKGIKELKQDYSVHGFCLQSFFGTEAVFRLICLLFNLMHLFKRLVLHDETPHLGTIRRTTLVIGAILGATGRTPVLRLGLRGRWRDRFAVLLERIAAMPTVVTVAQLTNLAHFAAPRPWRPRPAKPSARASRRAAFAFN